MSDIAQGVGFDVSNLPSYEELANKIGVSDKLEKASQALQTAQLTHQVLSNYKPYQELTKSLSEAIFDPVKAKFEKTVQEGVSKIAGKFNPTGEGEGLASKFIKTLGDNPQELLKLAKNPKALPKSLINKAIESSNLSAEEKALAKAVSEGQIAPKTLGKKVIQQAIEKSDAIPDELKALAKSASEGKIPTTQDAKNVLQNIVDKADIPDDLKSLAKAAATGDRQTFMNSAKNNIGNALDKSDLPDEAKSLAKSALSGENLSSDAKTALNTALDNSNLSPEIKSISKAVISGSKKQVADEASRTLNSIVEKSNLPPEVQNLAKAAASGKAPTMDDAKQLAQSILPEDIKAQLPEFENLAQVSEKAKAFAELPKLAQSTIEKKIGKMPADLVDNLRNAGIPDQEIALNRDIDFAKIAREAPNKFIDPFEFPDLQLAEAQKAYRASKYLKNLAEPATDSGMGPGGDSTLARLIKNNVPSEITEAKGYTPKSKLQIKEEAKARKLGRAKQQEGSVEEQPKTVQDVTQTESINQNRELSNEALQPYIEKLQTSKPIASSENAPPQPSEISPAPEETGIGSGTETGSVSKEVSSGGKSVSSELQKTTDESLTEDEDPLGAGISAVLEIATLATMLGGIFAPKPKEPVVVGGYQSGV